MGSCREVANTRILTLSIEDTGIGISQENQRHIFTPFSQAETSTTREYGGTGIGLSIVKQLTLMMGGDINLSSKVGEGSLFTVTLVLMEAEEPKTSSENEATIDVSSLSYKMIKVLVVEDNKINQLIVQKQLSPLDIHCDFANDGEKAILFLENAIPDLILMDLQMPIMDGFTASSIIKQTPHLQQIPIVILSASVGKEDKDKALELGIEDFINKPFQQADLIRILEKYIKKQPINIMEEVEKFDIN
jgi:CheY-like chemotaxis protein